MDVQIIKPNYPTLSEEKPLYFGTDFVRILYDGNIYKIFYLGNQFVSYNETTGNQPTLDEKIKKIFLVEDSSCGLMYRSKYYHKEKSGVVRVVGLADCGIELTSGNSRLKRFFDFLEELVKELSKKKQLTIYIEKDLYEAERIVAQEHGEGVFDKFDAAVKFNKKFPKVEFEFLPKNFQKVLISLIGWENREKFDMFIKRLNKKKIKISDVETGSYNVRQDRSHIFAIEKIMNTNFLNKFIIQPFNFKSNDKEKAIEYLILGPDNNNLTLVFEGDKPGDYYVAFYKLTDDFSAIKYSEFFSISGDSLQKLDEPIQPISGDSLQKLDEPIQPSTHSGANFGGGKKTKRKRAKRKKHNKGKITKRKRKIRKKSKKR